MVTHQGMVHRCNSEGHRCINSVLVNDLTKGQGGAILLLECKKLEELKKIVKLTNRV